MKVIIENISDGRSRKEAKGNFELVKIDHTKLSTVFTQKYLVLITAWRMDPLDEQSKIAFKHDILCEWQDNENGSCVHTVYGDRVCVRLMASFRVLGSS